MAIRVMVKKAFEIAQQALALSLELRDGANIVLSLVEIGKSYRNIGDHASALEYYRKAAAWNPWKIQWAYRPSRNASAISIAILAGTIRPGTITRKATTAMPAANPQN